MLPDRVSNPGPLTYESGALPIALRGPAAVEVRGPLYHGYSRGKADFISPFTALSLSDKWVPQGMIMQRKDRDELCHLAAVPKILHWP